MHATTLLVWAPKSEGEGESDDLRTFYLLGLVHIVPRARSRNKSLAFILGKRCSPDSGEIVGLTDLIHSPVRLPCKFCPIRFGSLKVGCPAFGRS